MLFTGNEEKIERFDLNLETKVGKQDSSQTRVVPVFDQLHAMDKSGKSWLAKLLNLPMRPDRRNPDILKLLPLIEAKWGN